MRGGGIGRTNHDPADSGIADCEFSGTWEEAIDIIADKIRGAMSLMVPTVSAVSLQFAPKT